MRVLTVRVKIRQIPHVNFEMTSQFLFKFCIILHCLDTELLYKFLAHAFSTLDKRIPSKSQFDNFKCSGEYLPNSSCHFPNHKSVFLPIFHHSSVSWKITPTFLDQTSYTLHKRNQSKCKFLRLSSAQVKIHQILVVSATRREETLKYRCVCWPSCG